MTGATKTHTGRMTRRLFRPGSEKRWTDPRPPPYEIQRWEEGAQANVVVASGELDLHAAPAMKETLASLASSGHTHLVIDMSAATFVDSAMIGVLAGYLQETRGGTGSLAIVCANENVLRTIRIAGLDPQQQYNLSVAANEALANAIEHGLPCSDGKIEMWVDERGAALTVGVRNRGDFILEPLPPDPLRERGRGLGLMRHMVDEMSLEHENDLTTVQLSIGR